MSITFTGVRISETNMSPMSRIYSKMIRNNIEDRKPLCLLDDLRGDVFIMSDDKDGLDICFADKDISKLQDWHFMGKNNFIHLDSNPENIDSDCKRVLSRVYHVVAKTFQSGQQCERLRENFFKKPVYKAPVNICHEGMSNKTADKANRFAKSIIQYPEFCDLDERGIKVFINQGKIFPATSFEVTFADPTLSYAFTCGPYFSLESQNGLIASNARKVIRKICSDYDSNKELAKRIKDKFDNTNPTSLAIEYNP